MGTKRYTPDVFSFDEIGLHNNNGLKVDWDIFIDSTSKGGAVVTVGLHRSLLIISMIMQEDTPTGFECINIAYNLDIWDWMNYRDTSFETNFREYTNEHIRMALLPDSDSANTKIISQIKDSIDRCINSAHSSKSTYDIYHIVHNSIGDMYCLQSS